MANRITRTVDVAAPLPAVLDQLRRVVPPEAVGATRYGWGSPYVGSVDHRGFRVQRMAFLPIGLMLGSVEGTFRPHPNGTFVDLATAPRPVVSTLIGAVALLTALSSLIQAVASLVPPSEVSVLPTVPLFAIAAVAGIVAARTVPARSGRRAEPLLDDITRVVSGPWPSSWNR